MVGPDYAPPAAPVAEDWIDGPAAPSAERDDSLTQWWTLFDDPALTALVEEALAQNLSLRSAGLRVLEARAVRGISVGEFFPQTQEAFGGIGGTATSANGPLAQGDRFYSDASIGLQAAWELDFWGKFRRGIESSDAALLATVADYDTVLLSLVSDVATNYVLVRSFEERLALARSNVQLQRDTLDLTDVRLRAGAVSELDVATARALLATTEALIPQLEDGRRQTLAALSVLVGRTPSELTDVMGGAGVTPAPPAGIALGVPADLLRRRPDVRRAERFAAAASAQIGVAEADFYPAVSITGATGFLSSDISFSGQRSDLDNIFDADSFQGFIGLSFSWPILNYGRIENNVRVRDAQFQQAVTEFQNTVLRAAAEVEAGLSSFLRNRERAAHLGTAVTAQQRAVEISLIQYRNGAIDFIRVNSAQTDLVTQQDQLATARAATAVGAISTFRALGGGWEVRVGREFVDRATAEEMRERTDWGDLLAPDYDGGSDLFFDRPPETPAGFGADAPDQASGTDPG
jgi:NodT family efflux transporter outer membrane factor (OMF) lipoprotein